MNVQKTDKKFKLQTIPVCQEVFEAKKIVGEPLYKGNGSNDSINVTYYYTGDAKLINANIKSDFAWY